MQLASLAICANPLCSALPPPYDSPVAVFEDRELRRLAQVCAWMYKLSRGSVLLWHNDMPSLCVNRGRGLRQHNVFDASAVAVAACQQGQSAVPGLKPQNYVRRVGIIMQSAPDKTCLTRMQSRRRTEYQYYMRAKSSVTVRIQSPASLSTYPFGYSL